MTEWEFISVAISLILGLAVALVLAGALTAFRARGRTKLSPVVIAWTIYIFVSQLQFWWGPVRALGSLERISGPVFVAMTWQAVILFLAGGAILPADADDYPRDLSTYFEEDGRWAVLIYAAYWLLGIPILNMGVFAISLADPSNITGVLLGVLSAMVFWSSRWRVPATVLAGVVLAVNTLTAGQNVRELPGLGG